MYILCANIELADKTDESALDITAADIAPNPTNEIPMGVRYCKTRGRVNRLSLIPPSSFRNVEFAPSTAGQSKRQIVYGISV